MLVEEYLKPGVIRQIKRLDLRAKFVARGFLHGLHASPLHGFSVQFSEHRRYTPGDDPRALDWRVYARTDKYYIRRYEAETNLHGYLVMDLSRSMDYTFRQELTKFDYAVCLAAALAWLMLSQQDPVGLVTFSDRIRDSVAPKSRRTQLANVLSILSKARPDGATDLSASLNQLAAMLRQRSLIMLFSDLLTRDGDALDALARITGSGHDVIIFHVLDEAEVTFPFRGQVLFKDTESDQRINADAVGIRQAYIDGINQWRESLATRCRQRGIDYLPLDTSQQFDRALTEYLHSRRSRM
jgi:uncharacterized protein (DUF58 family)